MKSLSLISMCLLTQLCYSQGEFVDRGQGAFGGELSFAYGDEAVGLGGSIGASIKGTVDLGFSYALIHANTLRQNIKSLSRAYGPFLGVHLLKQGESLPFSFAIQGLYQTQEFTATFSEKTAKIRTWTWGLALFTTSPMSNSLKGQPSISLSFTKATSGPPIDFRTLELGFAFLLESANTRYVIRPAIAFSQDQLILALGFAILTVSGEE